MAADSYCNFSCCFLSRLCYPSAISEINELYVSNKIETPYTGDIVVAKINDIVIKQIIRKEYRSKTKKIVIKDIYENTNFYLIESDKNEIFKIRKNECESFIKKKLMPTSKITVNYYLHNKIINTIHVPLF